MLTSTQIRRQFIEYFVSKHGHTFVPSSPVVPHGDPTLLFTNAGMNQFKDVFLATGRREYTRAANTQKCIRAGGKHNDLEDVGKDTYHHTFFEMLGNWSFGDYFKVEAIEWAWDLLTNVWGIDKTRLHATYFQGDASEGLDPDIEARDLWLRLLPADHVHPGNKKDNFWEMGESGPCGPCTEIHIDRTPGKTGGNLVNAGDASVMEIWNLVFIQFNRDASGILSPLPAKHVDTGMGFERLCSVLQNKTSNYDTDVFTPLFTAIGQVTKARPYGGKLDDHVDTAYRVIADHIRCLTFALTDGATPSNEGRGYVLRRILRRAVRHGWQTLDMHEPFLYRLVPAVCSAMGEAFPELNKNTQRVVDLIKDEEQAFARTLDRGIALFDQAAARATERLAGAPQVPASSSRAVIDAEDAFKLHDTFGFPLDLTQVMAEERGLGVDVAGFNLLMEQAREQARAAGGKIDFGQLLLDIVQRDQPKATQFVGYEKTSATGTITCKLYDLGEVQALYAPMTPFYAEAGGQVGDRGTIETSDGQSGTAKAAVFSVTDTQKVGDAYFHIGKLVSACVPPGDAQWSFTVDTARRAKIMANHTGTHIMNHKLRAVLGEHVQQKGSLVDDEKLRFDFSHNASLDTVQLERVEQDVNADIAADLPVYTEVTPQEDALKIYSLRAVFGEKYPPRVRCVTIGVPMKDLYANPDNKDWFNYSIEFCGGTHLPKTGDAEGFVIISEEAVAKGVRRITALTGKAAHEAAAHGEMLLSRVQALKGAPADQLTEMIAEFTAAMGERPLSSLMRERIRSALSELQKIVKDHDKQRSKQASGDVIEVARNIADAATGNVIVARIETDDANALRTAMDVIRKKKPEAALLLGAVTGDKCAFVASVPQALIDKGLKAGDWVREVAKAAGGGGGGRPDMAQAGGKDPAKLDEALEAGRTFAASRI